MADELPPGLMKTVLLGALGLFVGAAVYGWFNG